MNFIVCVYIFDLITSFIFHLFIYFLHIFWQRPKTGDALCKECFYQAFEEEVHHTITVAKLFTPGDYVAVAASGRFTLHNVAVLGYHQWRCLGNTHSWIIHAEFWLYTVYHEKYI